MGLASKNTSDPRMQALAAASTALAAKSAVDAVQGGQALPNGNAADQVGGINISLSLGSTQSQSESSSQSSTVVSSTLSAGNNVSLKATEGDIKLIGSQLAASNSAFLDASGKVNLQAAANTSSSQNANSGSSAIVGLGFALGSQQNGFTIQAGASQSKGSGNGADTVWTNTEVNAGNKVSITSGSDTNLKGATVTGNQVTANVGGNLNIESLQDTSTYHSSSNSAGASVSLCIPPFCAGVPSTGSISASKSKIDSDYASVTRQSGLKAGDGGFQVDVKGNTDLKGGAITSTDKAVQDNRNTFSTGGTLTTSDIQNKADYNASSASVTIGTGLADGTFKPQGSSAGFGKDSGSASSTTQAAISGLAGNTAARTGDAETGLQEIFDADKVQKDIAAQTLITQTFGSQASKAVGDYANSKMKEATLLNAQAQIAERSGNSELAEQLKGQASALENDWGPNGTLRLAAHTVIGGLTGGVAGVAGAVTGTLTAPAVSDALAAAEIDGLLATTLTAIASTAAGAAAGGTAGAGAAFNEVTNNWLSDPQKAQRTKELRDAKTPAEQLSVLAKWGYVSTKQDLLTLGGMAAGLSESGWNDVKGIASFLANPAEGLSGLKQLVSSPEARARLGETLVNDFTARIDRMSGALVTGGDENASQLGHDLGTLLWQTGSVLTGAVGAAKGTAALANLGINVSANALESAALQFMKMDAGAITGFKSANEVNALMKSAEWAPAWKPGTSVAETVIKPGTRVQMVVDETTYLNYVNSGKTELRFGGWATFDSVPNQAYARTMLAITPEMKANVGYVIEVEITKPVSAQIGVVGAQERGIAVGGGNQVHFVLPASDRGSALKIVNERKLQ